MKYKLAPLLLGITLGGCNSWYIRSDTELGRTEHVDCRNNLPPYIGVAPITKTVLIYDPDNKIVSLGWDLEKKIVYATDECGKTTTKRF